MELLVLRPPRSVSGDLQAVAYTLSRIIEFSAAYVEGTLRGPKVCAQARPGPYTGLSGARLSVLKLLTAARPHLVT